MAHEISKTVDGRDAFAFVGKQAWHGLGQKLERGASKEVWRQEAGYDWECLVIPSQYEFQGELKTSDNFHMVRSDTGDSLGCMTGRYKPVQPAEVLDFFDDFVSADERFALETAGVLKGGKVLFVSAMFNENIEAAGEPHNARLLGTTSFDGKLASAMVALMEATVCSNTLTANMWNNKKSTIGVRHCTKWTPQVKAKAQKQLIEIAKQFDEYKLMADAMALTKMSKSATENFLKSVFFGPKEIPSDDDMTTNAKNQIEVLMQSYRDTVDEGREVGTAWTALNAVTRYVDHARTTRDHTGEGADSARMSSAIFGSGAALKQRALEMLRETLAKPELVTVAA